MNQVTKQELNQSIKTTKRPKFMKILGHKVKIPKDIKRLEIYDKKYHIYGDARISEIAFSNDELKDSLKNNLFIIAFIKSKKGRPIAFSVDLPAILSHRKARLANMINIQKVQESENPTEKVKTAAERIAELIPIEEGLEEEDIFDEFLSAMDDVQISMDIKRLIQLQFQKQ